MMNEKRRKTRRKTRGKSKSKNNKKIYKKNYKKTLKRVKKPRRKNYKKNSCAPKKKDEMLSFSCYTPEVLYKMRTIWNKRHPDAMIKTKNLEEIWMKLGEYMNETCDREACWIKSNLFKNEIEEKEGMEMFSPKSPESWKRNINEWLSSVDILKFMKQYEKAYHCFEFLGPSPIDFDTHVAYGKCVWEDLCNFKLSDTISRGKKKIGIVFNLDPHYKSGSHWVAVFINCNKKEVYYFDSYGDRCPTDIRRFIRKVENQSQKMGKKYTYKSNDYRHQYGNSECGMYCLYFITQLLKDASFSKFNKRIPDKKMENLRYKYFNV